MAKSLQPMKQIRAKCLECSGGSEGEVRFCQVFDCPLWALRFGKTAKRLRTEGRLDWLNPTLVEAWGCKSSN